MILFGIGRPFPKNTIVFKNSIYKQAFDKLDILFNDQWEVNYSMVNVLDIEHYHTGKTHKCLYNPTNDSVTLQTKLL